VHSNPNGEQTMPLYAAAEQAVRPPLTGGLVSRLLSSDPAEPRTA
jgi:hypothetical protein